MPLGFEKQYTRLEEERMAQYYFLAISLPKLEIGHKPDISPDELKTLLVENLTPSDLRKTMKLRWFYDLSNIQAFWIDEPLDYWGNLDRNELEEELLTGEGCLPKYVFSFLREYESKEDRLKYFPMLYFKYFDDLAENNSGFLRDYGKFERDLRLALVAYRARLLNRDLAKELQYEDPEADIIVQLMAQKGSKTFVPPTGFEDLLPMLEENQGHPYKQQQALLEYRFNRLQQDVGFDGFSIDYILLYLLEYIYVDRWMHMDKKKGMEIVDTLVKEVS